MAKYESKEKVDFNTTFGFVATTSQSNELSSQHFEDKVSKRIDLQVEQQINSVKTPKPLSSYITV